MLRMEKDLLEKQGLLRCEEHPDPVRMFCFIEAEKANFSIKFMCDRRGVTRQGFYTWRRRPPCQRRIVDAAYTAVIKRIRTDRGEVIHEGGFGDAARVASPRRPHFV